MKRKTYNWPKLKQEWLTGKYNSLREMCRKKRLIWSTVSKRAVKERWIEKKEVVEAKTEEKVIERTAEINANRRLESIEKIFKYAEVLAGLGFKNFEGKNKIAKESDALRSIGLGFEYQLRALKELRETNEEPMPNFPGQEINVNVNIANVTNTYRDMSNDQIALRRQQIAEERKRLEGSDQE